MNQNQRFKFGVVMQLLDDGYDRLVFCDDVSDVNNKRIDDALEKLHVAAAEFHDVATSVENARRKCDPSDGPFLTQEPEESDGFCDCPECCGE